jgi:hypothetical protein
VNDPEGRGGDVKVTGTACGIDLELALGLAYSAIVGTNEILPLVTRVAALTVPLGERVALMRREFSGLYRNPSLPEPHQVIVQEAR